MRSWVAGWTVSRGTPPPVDEGGWLRIDVGRPKESVRRVLLSPEALPDAFAVSVEDRACVKYAGVGGWPAPWEDDGPQWLMARAVADEAIPPLPQGYRLDVSVTDDVAVARVLAGDEVAADARAGIAGEVAVPDQVGTEPPHRRRGLGAVLMLALQTEARRLGATRQILVASPDGRFLYGRLGWTEVAPVASAHRQPAGGSARPVR